MLITDVDMLVTSKLRRHKESKNVKSGVTSEPHH